MCHYGIFMPGRYLQRDVGFEAFILSFPDFASLMYPRDTWWSTSPLVVIVAKRYNLTALDQGSIPTNVNAKFNNVIGLLATGQSVIVELREEKRLNLMVSCAPASFLFGYVLCKDQCCIRREAGGHSDSLGAWLNIMPKWQGQDWRCRWSLLHRPERPSVKVQRQSVARF